METLYDLLGALPDDNAEELRTAFRRAAKGAHPDLNPGDPDAALKFRRIVRASEILCDSEQRAAYDHLLDLARIEQRQVAKHAVARTVYKVASGVVAFAVAAIVWAGGYAVFVQMNSEYFVPAKPVEAAGAAPAEVAAAIPAAPSETSGDNAPPAKADALHVAQETVVPAALLLPIDNGGGPATDAAAPLDLTASDAKSLREHGIFAYRSGDLSGAVADFDRAIQLDPKFAPAYIDRGIVYYRLRKYDRAFADVAHAKRIEKSNHPVKSAAAAERAEKSEKSERSEKVSAPTQTVRRRTAAADPSRSEGPLIGAR
jgi:tetratricopeptide (TPR) repeat protein